MLDYCPYPQPTAETVRSTEGLLYFIWEREVIRLTREKGHDAPWTNDPIFSKYKFTNIHRRHDRVSKWIIKEIINLNLKDKHLWFTLLITRLVNWPPTLEKLIYEDIIPCSPKNFDSQAFSKTIEAFKKESPKIYSGAYMVYPTKKDIGGNKSTALAKHIISAAVDLADDVEIELWPDDSIKSIEGFVNVLSKCFGLSTFMAGQVAADLTYAKGHLDDAEDLYTYAPIGPGSSKGLNYLHNRKLSTKWTQGEFNRELIKIRKDIENKLEINDMTLHDVQNCMCEFSKYCRTALGEGVPKTLYKPETEF